MTRIKDFEIDTSKGFDCLNHLGHIVKHFDTYEEAEAYRLLHKGLITRWWVKVTQE